MGEAGLHEAHGLLAARNRRDLARTRGGALGLAAALAYLQNAVIVGAGDVGQLIGRKLLQHPEYGINLIGFVDAEPKERRPTSST